MNNLKHILQVTIAWLLLNAIVFPSVLQFAHIFEDHHHSFCGDIKTHLHEQELDCDLTQFVTTVFSFKAPSFNLEKVAFQEQEPIQNFSSLIFGKEPQSLALRGPPTV